MSVAYEIAMEQTATGENFCRNLMFYIIFFISLEQIALPYGFLIAYKKPWHTLYNTSARLWMSGLFISCRLSRMWYFAIGCWIAFLHLCVNLTYIVWRMDLIDHSPCPWIWTAGVLCNKVFNGVPQMYHPDTVDPLFFSAPHNPYPTISP